MKTYKTWEILKKLEEDPSLIIEPKQKGDENFTTHYFNDIFLESEYRVVQKSVSIDIAAKAFIKGANIRCEFPDSNDNKLTVKHWKQGTKFRLGVMEQDSYSITFYMLRVGKWFIEE